MPKIKSANDVFARINTDVLYPPFLEKLRLLAEALEARGVRFYATSGYRSWEEQDALYAQGRTKPGKRVTNAKGGTSAHQFGIAVDWTKDTDIEKDGLQPGWNEKDYLVLAEEAVKVGLEAGAYWKSFKDYPHIQLNLGALGLTLADLQHAYIKNKGLGGVYSLLNSKLA